MAAVIAFAQTGDQLFPWGDHAIVEGETLRAWFLHQLLGTYSRYGWHHPGPALFYWMAPWYELFGRSPAALNGAAALLNALAVGLLVAVAGRFAGRAAAYGAATLALLYVAQEGAVVVRDFWIPHTVILPFAGLVVVTAAAAAGAIRLVPVVALVACFLAETDLSIAPASAGVLAAGLIFWLATRGWRRVVWDLRVALVIAGTLVLCAVIWYPPIHEQLRPGEGNVTVIRHFFAQPDPGHSLSDGIDAVSNSLTVSFAGGRSANLAVPASAGAHVLLAVAIVALIGGLVFSLRSGRRFAAALCATALASVVAEIYAVTQIRGDLFTYLVDWFGAAAIPIWLAAGIGLLPELARLRRPSAPDPEATQRLDPVTQRFSLEQPPPRALVAVLAATACALAVLAVVAQARKAELATHDPAYSNPAEKPVVLAIRSYVARNHVRDPMLYIPHPSQWPIAAGAYIDRFSRDQKVAVDTAWLGVFGSKLAPTGHEDASIIFADAALPKPLVAPDARVIARVGGSVVYANLVRKASS